jgi:hypothetical protein
MSGFSINFRPFECGKCKYIVKDAIPKKKEDGSKFILMKFNLTDVNGVTEQGSAFFSSENAMLIKEFCEVNNLKDNLKSNKITPQDCVGKKSGSCTTIRAKDPRFINVTGFLKEEVLILSETKPTVPDGKAESFDDDIPF